MRKNNTELLERKSAEIVSLRVLNEMGGSAHNKKPEPK